MIRTLEFRICLTTFLTLSLTTSLLAADPQSEDVAKLAAGMEAWEKLKTECKNSYTYKVGWSSAFGFGHTTEIVVRDGKVVKRRYEEFNNQPRPALPGQPGAKPKEKGWVEQGESIGTHKQGAPAKTLDELYAEAKQIAAKQLGPSERRYLRFNPQGLPLACFYIDTRIADDAPATGLKITSIDLAAPK